MTRLQRGCVFAAKAVISVALIAYLVREIGVSHALAQAGRLSIWTALLVVVLLWAHMLLAALRWTSVLRALGYSPGYLAVARMTFVSLFFNQFLPSSIGTDAVRIWEAHRSGMRLGSSVHSVIVERAINFAALAALAAIGGTLWSTGRLPLGALLALWAVFAVVLIGVAVLASLDRLPHHLVPASARAAAADLAMDARRLFGSPARTTAAVLTVLASQAVLSAGLLLLARDLGIGISLADTLALFPAVMIAMSVPVSISGWGVREYAMVTAFGYAGAPATGMLTLSVTFALLAAGASLPGGVAWLMRRRRIASAPGAAP